MVLGFKKTFLNQKKYRYQILKFLKIWFSIKKVTKLHTVEHLMCPNRERNFSRKKKKILTKMREMIWQFLPDMIGGALHWLPMDWCQLDQYQEPITKMSLLLP